MPKHPREKNVQFEIQSEYVIIKYFGKQYIWIPSMVNGLASFLNEDTFEYDIVQNKDGKAIFMVDDIRKNTNILYQEIDPIKKTV